MDLFDLIGPVMIGPSSSHTAGAARIGLIARALLGESVARAEIAFHGSFAKTYRGHGTDRAIVGGLMDMPVDDPRLRDSLTYAYAEGMTVMFSIVNIRGAHPNTVRLKLTGVSGKMMTMEAASVGGGNIEIHNLNGMNVNFTGKENTLIIHNADEPGVIAGVCGCIAGDGLNIATLQSYRRKAGADSMMVMELDGVPTDALIDVIRGREGVHSAVFLKRRNL